MTYRVVRDPAPAGSAPAAVAGTPPAPGSMAQMAATPVPTADGPGLVWTVPAGWSEGPEKPMRKATLLVPGGDGAPGAELAITAFPGSVGSDLDNINRWRQQLGLPALSQSELGSSLEHVDVGALHVDLVDISGASQRMITAIVPHGGAKWFFKLTGPADVVARERDNFLAFIRGLRPQG